MLAASSVYAWADCGLHLSCASVLVWPCSQQVMGSSFSTCASCTLNFKVFHVFVIQAWFLSLGSNKLQKILKDWVLEESLVLVVDFMTWSWQVTCIVRSQGERWPWFWMRSLLEGKNRNCTACAFAENCCLFLSLRKTIISMGLMHITLTKWAFRYFTSHGEQCCSLIGHMYAYTAKCLGKANKCQSVPG